MSDITRETQRWNKEHPDQQLDFSALRTEVRTAVLQKFSLESVNALTGNSFSLKDVLEPDVEEERPFTNAFITYVLSNWNLDYETLVFGLIKDIKNEKLAKIPKKGNLAAPVFKTDMPNHLVDQMAARCILATMLQENRQEFVFPFGKWEDYMKQDE